MAKKNTLLVLAGPTAAGKSACAIKWAKTLHTEIVSADSRQFYKEMKIGTAAPAGEELKRIKHHFVGNLSVTDYYNVYKYGQEAIKVIENLFEDHEYVILTGGSGLYIDAVCKGMDEFPDADLKLRKNLHDMINNDRMEELKNMLAEKDPEYFSIVDKNNISRIIRALEVCIQTGQTYTSLRKQQQKNHKFKISKFCIKMPREVLYDRIDKRVDQMIENGLLKEVESLIPYRSLNALNTVGYKEIFDYFDKKCSIEESICRIKNNTHHYAKRQITWFKRDDSYKFITREEAENFKIQ